jgi:hypothetical protein
MDDQQGETGRSQQPTKGLNQVISHGELTSLGKLLCILNVNKLLVLVTS